MRDFIHQIIPVSGKRAEDDFEVFLHWDLIRVDLGKTPCLLQKVKNDNRYCFGHLGILWKYYSSFHTLYHTTQAFQRMKIVLRSEEHTSELQSRENLVCRLLLEKKKNE